MSVLVVGSIALDTVKTPFEEHADLLGGSASYAALGASFFSPVNLVGIVGDDFPKAHIELLRARDIDLAGVQIVPGKTFRWSGEYMLDMNVRETRSVELNVFEHFTPVLPDAYKAASLVLLANIGPNLQNHVLDQVQSPRFVIADTMDLWINIARPELMRLIQRVDLLILNDSEARLLTQETSLVRAGAKIRALGPRYVVVKKGEHGALLFGPDEFFSCGAYPLEDILDPTGAGDTFAGGVAGFLASTCRGDVHFGDLRKAIVWGSVLASFNVEAFSLERLRTLTQNNIDERSEMFRLMQHLEAV